MPSNKILAAKQAYVKELNEKLTAAMAGVVVSYNGISVADDTKLRKELRDAGVEYTVVKNTMLRLAVKGTKYEALAECFKGDTAIAISPEDPAAAARILCKFADADKTKRFTVKGGFCDGQVMDVEGVRSLSTMPTARVCCPCWPALCPASSAVWPSACRGSSTSRTKSLLPDRCMTLAA